MEINIGMGRTALRKLGDDIVRALEDKADGLVEVTIHANDNDTQADITLTINNDDMADDAADVYVEIA